jgi:hypothetical protein
MIRGIEDFFRYISLTAQRHGDIISIKHKDANQVWNRLSSEQKMPTPHDALVAFRNKLAVDVGNCIDGGAFPTDIRRELENHVQFIAMRRAMQAT